MTCSGTLQCEPTFGSNLVVAASKALEEIAGMAESDQKHALACLYVFNLGDAILQFSSLSSLKRELPRLFGGTPRRPSGLLAICKVDYNFTGESGRPDHAHC